MYEQLEKLFNEAVTANGSRSSMLLKTFEQHTCTNFRVDTCGIKVKGLNNFEAKLCLSNYHQRGRRSCFDPMEINGYFEHNISFDFSISIDETNNTVKINIQKQFYDNSVFYRYLSLDCAEMINLYDAIKHIGKGTSCIDPDKYLEYIKILLESQCITEIYKEWILKNFISTEYIA